MNEQFYKNVIVTEICYILKCEDKINSIKKVVFML